MSVVHPSTPHVGIMSNRAGASDNRRKKRPPNTGSKLLSQHENESFFGILPFDNYSLCAAVAEILQGQPEDRRWTKLHRGVVSLVKDYQSRAYYLRIFDIQNRTMLWELKMYKNFAVNSYVNCPSLLTFESEDSRVFGLNFTSPEEALMFKGHVDKRNEQERKSTNDQRDSSRVGATQPPIFTVSTNGTRSVPPQSPFNASGVTVAGSIPPSLTSQTVEKESRGFLGLRSKKKEKKAKIRKEDISNPTNFEHKAHVGWDQDNGFSNTVYDPNHIDDSVAQIIRAAGMDTAGMDKKTIKFVYDFIDTYQREHQLPVASIQNFATSSYKQQAPLAPLNNWGSSPSPPSSYASSSPAPPPPPSRGASVQLSAPVRPPPPPPSQGARGAQRPLPQVPHSPMTIRSDNVPLAPPPPPPPPSMSCSAPPPPPPPPPTTGGPPPPPPPPPNPPADLNNLPAPQSNRGNLLAEIQAGKTLRSVGNTFPTKPNTSAGDARGDVMAQIRQGAQLKKIDVAAEQEKRKSNQGGLSDMGGIAGALARALAERRQNMESDESDSDNDEKNEWSD